MKFATLMAKMTLNEALPFLQLEGGHFKDLSMSRDAFCIYLALQGVNLQKT